jgi:hypothetical protein
VVRTWKVSLRARIANCGVNDPGFNSQQRQEIFLFFETSRPALGPIRSSIELVERVKRSGSEADNSPQFSAEVNNDCSYTSATPICRLSCTGTVLPLRLRFQYRVQSLI